jgi:GDP-4-dehydro-6-deoxy-D-mannose reductase
MKALITGINGFVGQYLKKHLLSIGYNVYGIDHHSNNKDTFEADIRAIDKLGNIVKEIQPDEIYHLAGIANVAYGNIGDFYNVHALGTLNLYDAVEKSGGNPKILYVSTSNVYGIVPEDKQPIIETQPVMPVNHYGASKAAGEMISHKYIADGLRIIIVRSFNHTGPGQSESFVIPKLTKAFASQQPFIDLGNTGTKRDFTDVRDVVKAYSMVMQKAGAGDIYNVCSGKTYSIDDILGYLKNLTSHPIRIKRVDSLKRAVDPLLFIGNNQCLKKLGWSAVIPIEQTIKDMISFYNQQHSA